MRTKIKGRNIRTEYSVEKNYKEEQEFGKIIQVFTEQPQLLQKSEIVSYPELFDIDILCDTVSMLSYKFAISEDEILSVDNMIFRADLNELHIFTYKVCNEEEINKKESEAEYKKLIAAFNKQMIISNKRMMDYCDVNKLSYEDTDCTQLFRVIYPNSKYQIKNGVMMVMDANYIASDPMIYMTSSNIVTREL